MTLAETLLRPEVRAGALWGVAAAGAVAAGALLATAGGRRPRGWPAAGAAGVGAALLALRQGAGVPWPVVLALGLLILGGAVPLPWRLAALVPGALVMAAQVPASLPAWGAPVVALTAVAVAVAGPDLDAGNPPGVGPIFMAVAAVGAWACVPDVEHVAPVAAAFCIVAIGSVRPPLRVGGPMLGPAAGLVLWAAAAGSTGRPAALVGAAAGLGLFVAVPVGRRWSSERRRVPSVPLVAGQIAFVAVTSRIAGLRSDAGNAVALSAASLVAAGILFAVTRREPRADGVGDPSAP